MLASAGLMMMMVGYSYVRSQYQLRKARRPASRQLLEVQVKDHILYKAYLKSLKSGPPELIAQRLQACLDPPCPNFTSTRRYTAFGTDTPSYEEMH